MGLYIREARHSGSQKVLTLKRLDGVDVHELLEGVQVKFYRFWLNPSDEDVPVAENFLQFTRGEFCELFIRRREDAGALVRLSFEFGL
jgi:hypothetical protein